MEHFLQEIEQNIASRKETDRIMWFSMWAVLSIASFGLAWFPMIYYTLKRKNDHFLRQKELENLILNKLRKKQNLKKSTSKLSKTKNQSPIKNEKVLTLSTILIIPAFYIFYILKNDLQKHEEHEQDFLNETATLAKNYGITLNIQSYMTTPSFPKNKYIILSVVTFGLAAAYWLYRIFNDYNNHFKMQWIIEDELLSLIKSIEKKANKNRL